MSELTNIPKAFISSPYKKIYDHFISSIGFMQYKIIVIKLKNPCKNKTVLYDK